MPSVVSAITNTVPISQFNRGLAGQIFEDVKRTGAKVVMKNNSAECVLMAPEEYVRLMDELKLRAAVAEGGQIGVELPHATYAEQRGMADGLLLGQGRPR
jgi:PHD/YefM family antitoxin component YafN of YafNO toxin-antitoxin module